MTTTRCLFCGEEWDDAPEAPVHRCTEPAPVVALPSPTRNVRRSDPDTSWEAAFDHATPRANDRWTALLALREAPGGLTDYELADRIHRQQNSAGKRRGELRDLGLVEDSGLRRLTPAGASAIVWRVTALGSGK